MEDENGVPIVARTGIIYHMLQQAHQQTKKTFKLILCLESLCFRQLFTHWQKTSKCINCAKGQQCEDECITIKQSLPLLPTHKKSEMTRFTISAACS